MEKLRNFSSTGSQKNAGHSEIDQGVLHSTIVPFCAVKSGCI